MNSTTTDNDLECKKIINKKDYYDILGVTKESLDDEIRKAYKKLAIKFHPDKNNSQFSSDAFKKISQSFSVLSHKDKKQKYDLFGSEDGVGHSGQGFYRNEDPFEIFKMFFGNNMPRSNSAQYVFRNGGGDYKVYSNFPQGRSQSPHNHSDGEEENDDIFSHFLGQRMHRTNQNRNHNNANNGWHNNYSFNNRNTERNFKEQRDFATNPFVNMCNQLVQMIPLIFLMFFVLSPYLNRA